MIIQAELRRKQSEYEGEACSVDILMPTAVSLWAFLRSVRDPAAAAHHPFPRFAANQISEYGGTIYGL